MAAEPRLRNLPAGNPTLLFRAVERQLRADPLCAAVVKTWQTWEGKPSDKTDVSITQCPWVQITPRMGPEDWWAASTMKGWLYLECQVATEGTCIDDMLNLWWALQRGLYGNDADAREAFSAKLRATLGGVSGLPKFSYPVIMNNPPTDGFILAAGWIALEYRFDTKPTAPGY